MQMKAKKIICLMLALVLIVSFAGCGLISVDEEKDKATVVAKVNDKEYTKGEFNNFLTTYYILYEMYGYTIPTEEEELTSFKTNLFNSYVYDLCYYEEALAAQVEPEDTDYLNKSFDDMMTVAETQLGSAEAVDTLLEKYGLDRTSFKDVASQYITLSAYSQAYTATSPDFHDVIIGTAVKVNGTAIDIPTFNFYAMTLILMNYYFYNTSPSTESEYLSMLDSTVNYVSYTQALIDYGKKQGYEITDEEAVASYDETYAQIIALFGEDYLNTFFKSYYLNEEDIAAGKAFIGRGYLVEKKIQEELEADITPTEDEVNTYYVENLSSYTETVSAYHILTENETKAKALEKEAKGTPEGFMALYEKIKANEGTDKADADIKEAADLGEFKYTAMVEEFSEPVFAMEKGEVKGMIQSEFGYHLVYKYDESGIPTLEADYDKIAADCKSSKVSDAKTEKLTDIRNSAKVSKEDYAKTNEMRVEEYLKDKYNVKTYEKKALR